MCLVSVSVLLISCQTRAQPDVSLPPVADSNTPDSAEEKVVPTPIADAATILSKKQVPILCYHQIREFRTSDSKVARDYIVPPAIFQEQMQILADSGYTSILPDALMEYLETGKPVPEKSVMITFDDTDLEQYTVAAPMLKKLGFNAVYFVMTVSLGRPNYMSRDQVKELADDGNLIASHTWDHHNVKKYAGNDWITQIEKPSKQIEAITGKRVEYFAYPFGLWNKEAIPELKKRGFKAAFQLSEKLDSTDPLFTIRRMIVPGSWTGKSMMSRMRGTFR
ncbi:MAG: polysaccharide deacetylase family protein [Chitinophagaceae bacterium]|nr:polysaccharide deacetylase family protein [Chitinophagaceae bacterium]